MNSEYVNPIGQRVVDVDFGYKIYDNEDRNLIINIVGDNTKSGQYIYLDRDAFEKGSDEICFMAQSDLVAFEQEVKRICYKVPDWNKAKEKINKLLKTPGFVNFNGKSLKTKYLGSWENFLNKIQLVYGIVL